MPPRHPPPPDQSDHYGENEICPWEKVVYQKWPDQIFPVVNLVVFLGGGSRPKKKPNSTMGKAWSGHFWYTHFWVPAPPPPFLALSWLGDMEGADLCLRVVPLDWGGGWVGGSVACGWVG